MASILKDGFEIHRGIFTTAEINTFRAEADHIAESSGSVCVRHVRGRSNLFNEMATSGRMRHLVSGGRVPVRSLLFDKTAEQNWSAAWHQDLTIAVREKIPCAGYKNWTTKEGAVHVQPPVELLEKMVTARIHLDDADSDNGALIVIPGSHQLGRIHSEKMAGHTTGDSFACECRAGDVMLMSPLILHSSHRSLFPKRRRVVHIEFAPPDALDPNLNWHEA